MSETIKQSELRNNNAEIMRWVAHGESFTVTVHGQPVADLVPHQRPEHRRRRLIPAAEFDEAMAQLPPVDVAQWKRDRAEADVIFGDDQPADPWGGGRGEKVIKKTDRKILLDTSVIIDPPAKGSASFADLVAVSAITVGELHYGVGTSKDPI